MKKIARKLFEKIADCVQKIQERICSLLSSLPLKMCEFRHSEVLARNFPCPDAFRCMYVGAYGNTPLHKFHLIKAFQTYKLAFIFEGFSKNSSFSC